MTKPVWVNLLICISLVAPPAAVWDSMKGHFFDHVEQVNLDLRRRGLKPLGAVAQ
jgi:homogentisate 1,2-dioxygenase